VFVVFIGYSLISFIIFNYEYVFHLIISWVNRLILLRDKITRLLVICVATFFTHFFLSIFPNFGFIQKNKNKIDLSADEQEAYSTVRTILLHFTLSPPHPHWTHQGHLLSVIMTIQVLKLTMELKIRRQAMIMKVMIMRVRKKEQKRLRLMI